MTSLDLAVIGAGAAGFAAVIRASELGASALLVGKGVIGGTCVNTGCIPSKTLIRAVGAAHDARAAARFAGIAARGHLTDWSIQARQKDELVGTLREGSYVEVLRRHSNVVHRQGHARLTAEGLAVEGEALRVPRIIVATGAAPATPSIAGAERIPWLDSAGALALDRLPRSLLVIGGGFVGCELGQMFARAGVEVAIICRSRLLPSLEPEIGEALATHLRADGVDVRCGARYEAIRATASGVALSLREADGTAATLAAERVLAAVGRQPNTAALGLRELGVALDAGGGIVVDDRLRSTRPGLYAAGDVTGRHMFVYMAAYAGKLAAENALAGDLLRYDDGIVPQVVFTDPQAASVGLGERAARAQGLSVATSTIPLARVPRAQVARDTRGLVKLVADRTSGRLLGAHLLAPEAGDSIQSAMLALKHGMTVGQLAETLFPYLTTVEGLKLAALAFNRDLATLSCCAG